jgi:uncharacterized protein (DUF1330 family)
MSAYMIVTARIADRAAFIEGYGVAAAALVAKFGGKYVLRGAGATLLEGCPGGADWDGASMAISEWPGRAAARLCRSEKAARGISRLSGAADRSADDLCALDRTLPPNAERLDLWSGLTRLA